jgi:NadR type nicotinamide-nucleotide adenylyltransferase
MKKIVAIGPESTGKSSLCEQLAKHYSTVWCPEYAREYLKTHGTEYNYDDLLTIARGQVALEEKFESGFMSQESGAKAQSSNSRLPTPDSRLLFIDTDMYVMKVWCEFVFGKCHQWILDQIERRKYDLYLLCDVDLPWVADELREYPDLEPREKLYAIYKELMQNQGTTWIEISGNSEERFSKAVAAVDELLKK